jgi:REP element-mobilizing transposase RayT
VSLTCTVGALFTDLEIVASKKQRFFLIKYSVFMFDFTFLPRPVRVFCLMANTYTQIHLQIIFAVQNRISLIQPQWKEELYKYLTGIIQGSKHKLIVINGIEDHVHLLVGMRPNQSLSDLLQHVKGDSSAWINKCNLVRGKFQWQEGYAAFSYSKSQLPAVINYIKNQEIHHKKKTFIEEYKEFLDLFEVPYDERYIFQAVL